MYTNKVQGCRTGRDGRTSTRWCWRWLAFARPRGAKRRQWAGCEQGGQHTRKSVHTYGHVWRTACAIEHFYCFFENEDLESFRLILEILMPDGVDIASS